MNKDIIAWSRKKLQLDSLIIKPVLYKEREVWWAKIGHNIGSEQNGSYTTYSRPVLIFKGFSETIFWIIPLSTTSRRGKYDIEVELNGQISVAVLSQLRAIDIRRLGNKMGMISQGDMAIIRNKVRSFIT